MNRWKSGENTKRLPIKLIIDIDKLFRQDNEIISDINESIEVVDISKRGIGFFM